MKLTIIVLMLGLTSFCFGQKEDVKKTVDDKSVEIADKLKKELNLSEKQYEKVKLIYINYLKDKDELGIKIKELEKRKKTLKTNKNDMINNVLTPEQKKELERQKTKKKKKK